MAFPAVYGDLLKVGGGGGPGGAKANLSWKCVTTTSRPKATLRPCKERVSPVQNTRRKKPPSHSTAKDRGDQVCRGCWGQAPPGQHLFCLTALNQDCACVCRNSQVETSAHNGKRASQREIHSINERP